MELYMRIALVALGLLLVSGILWDALRRRRQMKMQYKLYQNNDRAQDNLPQGDYNPDDPLEADYSKPFEKKEPVFAKEKAAEEPKTCPAPAVKPSTKILTLYVMAAPGERFIGYDLLQAILAAGLRFGEMGIFHRFASINNTSDRKLFSLASAVEPGTFDIHNMGAASSPGLILFMQASSNQSIDDSLNSFSLMLEAAQSLVDDLDGVLLDSKREPLTIQMIENMRNEVYALFDPSKQKSLAEV